MTTKRLTVTVEEDQVTALRKLAGDHGTSVGIVTRAAVTHALEDADALGDTIDALAEADRAQRRAIGALGGIRRAERLGYRDTDTKE